MMVQMSVNISVGKVYKPNNSWGIRTRTVDLLVISNDGGTSDDYEKSHPSYSEDGITFAATALRLGVTTAPRSPSSPSRSGYSDDVKDALQEPSRGDAYGEYGD